MTLTVYNLQREGADRLLFLLHGWSAEQHHLAAYVPLIDPHDRFTAICPRAIHDLDEGDGASWYTRDETGPEPASFLAAVATVEGLIVDTALAEGIPTERCVLGGFSQGGFLTLALAGKPDPLPYGGVWAMCCGLPDVPGLGLDLSGGAGRPALIQVGDHDRIISPDRGRAAADALTAGGWSTRFHGYDMAHSQTIEMMVDAREWLARIP